MKSKILFISDHGDPLEPLGSEQAGGQNNYVRQLALALEQEGYSVDVVTHWNSLNTPKIDYFGSTCRVIRLAAGKHKYVPKDQLYKLMPEFFQELTATLNLEDYDIMHTHYWLSGLVGSFIKKEYDISWIHTNHSLGIAKKQATGNSETLRLLTEKMILTSADRVVATSPTEKKLIYNFIGKPSPVHVISIGVDDAFTPKLYKHAITPYFAFAGRLQTTKGIYTLLQAFHQLCKNDFQATSPKLLIAGGSKTCISSSTHLPKSTKLRNAVKGLEHRVKFIGPQNQKQLARLFSNSVATIVPSQYESFGMVAAEAQACGSPVIASKVGGLQDVVKHEITGIHIEHNNSAELKQAMELLMKKPHFAKRLGKQAAAYAQQEFNWSVLAYKMSNLYKGVINEKSTILTGD